MKRARSTLVAATTAAVFVAGCGGGSPKTGPSPESAAEVQSDHAMLDFARCMRANGVDMPDPFHRPGHAGLSIELPDGVTQMAAYRTCGHYLARIIAMKQAGARAETATVRVSLVRYAQCMRTHGVPMLDPTPDGSLSLGNVPGISSGGGRYTPQFHSADTSCRHLLPPTVRDNGTGP
jgi:hypothetical protein